MRSVRVQRVVDRVPYDLYARRAMQHGRLLQRGELRREASDGHDVHGRRSVLERKLRQRDLRRFADERHDMHGSGPVQHRQLRERDLLQHGVPRSLRDVRRRKLRVSSGDEPRESVMHPLRLRRHGYDVSDDL